MFCIKDLTIQHIRGDFTVKVYENNARICLECHDINQFNQCQGKLYELYKDGIKGNKYVFSLKFIDFKLKFIKIF